MVPSVQTNQQSLSASSIVFVALGVVLIIAATVLAFVFPAPDALQILMDRVILGLGAGFLAGFFVGQISIATHFNVFGPGTAKITGTGTGIVVFLIIYLINPPNLIAAGQIISRLLSKP